MSKLPDPAPTRLAGLEDMAPEVCLKCILGCRRLDGVRWAGRCTFPKALPLAVWCQGRRAAPSCPLDVPSASSRHRAGTWLMAALRARGDWLDIPW